ncbi:MAG: ATP-binding cassette domain-containing protein [Lachnospiraceae bacterium]|nr:ATP-binding cassette domain-containing protein [Lachnospiraceae bacterium]
MINFENVSKFILEDISFNLPKGEVVGLIGASGTGKTTLVKLAAGILKPEHGRVSVLGKNPVLNRGKYSTRVGVFMTGIPVLSESDSALNGIGILAKMYDIPELEFQKRYDELSQLFGFRTYERERLKELSVGQRRRIELAATFIPEPELLLLDEPEIGLDEEAKQTLEEVIKERAERGMTVLITSHDLQSISNLSTRIMILSPNSGKHSGMIFYGTEDVLRHRFLPVNRMTIKYEGSIPMVDDLPLVKYSLTHDEFICEYDERYVSSSEILTVIMKHTRVTDIKIKKPDLEQIILRER